MDDFLIQRSRYVLRSRLRTAQTCPIELFETAAAQALFWVDAHPILGNIVLDLQREQSDVGHYTASISANVINSQGNPSDAAIRGDHSRPEYTARTPRDHAAICLHVVRAITLIAGYDGRAQASAVIHLASFFRQRNQFFKVDEAVEFLRDVAFKGLYEYLDEQLDSRLAIYGLLLKYRQRCEWFRRHRLRAIAKAGLEGKKGEGALAIDLYDWLLSQGVDLIIEPVSVSGDPELALRDATGRHLVVDATYIRCDAVPSDIRSVLASGFHRVQRYCTDLSEPNGFLVVFIESSGRITLDIEQSDGLPFFRLGGKEIFYLPIQISDDPSASKSGRAEEVNFSREELCEPIQ